MYKTKQVQSKSSKPILYYDPRSPACRAVLLVAAEIGIKLDLRLMDPVTNPNNMLYPVLEDNGLRVDDCKRECVYLADKYSSNDNLCPKELEARNYVMNSLFFGSREIYLRAQYEPDSECAKVHIKLIEFGYEVIELWLTKHRQPYVCGKHLTIADLCCIVVLPRGHELVPIDAVKFPKLFRWVKRMSALPYYKKCNFEGAKLLESWTKCNGEDAKSLKNSDKNNGKVVNIIKRSTKRNVNGAKSLKSSTKSHGASAKTVKSSTNSNEEFSMTLRSRRNLKKEN